MNAKHVSTTFFKFFSQSFTQIDSGHTFGHTGGGIKDKYRKMLISISKLIDPARSGLKVTRWGWMVYLLEFCLIFTDLSPISIFTSFQRCWLNSVHYTYIIKHITSLRPCVYFVSELTSSCYAIFVSVSFSHLTVSCCVYSCDTEWAHELTRCEQLTSIILHYSNLEIMPKIRVRHVQMSENLSV